MWITSTLQTVLTPTILALGNFDGVHRGHQQVIASLQDLDIEAAYLTVVAFDPHPQEFFTGKPRLLLTPPEEKGQVLARLGVDQLVLLPFNERLASLSPQDFVEEVLVRQLQAKAISVGFNFCFGYQRAGTTEDLVAIATPAGVRVTIVPPQQFEQERISSSAIRKFLAEGAVERANQLLGRPYTLIGRVIGGDRRGRQLGFPTANLELPANKFLPQPGVYAVRVTGDGLGQQQFGVMNLGCRPTVQGTGTAVEVHLLDWSGDLYGQSLTVYLEKFLRPEQRFPSLEALQAQIRVDCQTARHLFDRFKLVDA
uniref:Riboflavin biosynthesis protein n=1 Tax=Cyanothece sp. (strain PCC 7425 / ATCC 29141) TaxID=395961 RepID=B8HX51_CYAP4